MRFYPWNGVPMFRKHGVFLRGEAFIQGDSCYNAAVLVADSAIWAKSGRKKTGKMRGGRRIGDWRSRGLHGPVSHGTNHALLGVAEWRVGLLTPFFAVF